MTALGDDRVHQLSNDRDTRSVQEPPHPAPAHGDFLIAKDTADRKASYVLSILPGLPQIRCRTYDHAVSTASAWALQQRVTIWFTQNGRTFTMVTPTSATTPRPRVMGLRDVQ